MSNYLDWCRFCASFEETSNIRDSNIDIDIAERILNLEVSNYKICCYCSTQLLQIQEFSTKATSLNRMFVGLGQENESDLSVKRLNAYRAHFDIDTRIPDDVQQLKIEESYIPDNADDSRSSEYQQDEYQNDGYIEYIEGEETKTETIDEDIETSLIVHEEYEFEEEVYYEDPTPDDDATEAIIEEGYILEEVNDWDKLKSSNTEKSEEEEMFTFKCHVCNVPEFLKMKFLTQHCKSAHNCLPVVKCCSEDCDKLLSTWRRLLIHKEKHFPSNNRLKCPECQNVYVTEIAFEKHRESHKQKFICTFCQKEFKEKKTLRWHMTRHQNTIEERRSFACHFPGCDMKFITKQSMQNHIGMKHERSVVCQCTEPNCDKSFYTKKSFYEHLRNTHTDRKYFCDECSFKAKTKTALKIHKDVHNTNNSYSCDLCDANFSIFRRLKSHMVCHSDATPFKCLYCESTFKRSKELKIHTLIHTKEKPFRCQFCSKTFSDSANSRKHKLREHPQELKKWEAENGIGGRKNLQCYQ